jgi:hypothetical protein
MRTIIAAAVAKVTPQELPENTMEAWLVHFRKRSGLSQTEFKAEVDAMVEKDRVLYTWPPYGGTTPPGAPPPSGPPPAPTEILEAIILQQRKHELKPFAKQDNDESGWEDAPWVITQDVGRPFSLKGIDLLPSWGNFNRRAWLAEQWWSQISPWFQLFYLSTTTRNDQLMNVDRNGAALLSRFDLLIWYGGTNWVKHHEKDYPYWVDGYRNDYGGDATVPVEIKNVGGKLICRPSADGKNIVHGGGAGSPRTESNPANVKGVLVRAQAQLTSWNGQPVDEAKSFIGLSMGCDGYPPGTRVNPDFMPAAFNPGFGAGGFVRLTNTPKMVHFTTLTESELRANPPPV